MNFLPRYSTSFTHKRIQHAPTNRSSNFHKPIITSKSSFSTPNFLLFSQSSKYYSTEKPIPLPPPRADNTVRELTPGSDITLDELGPIVIREDGSMGRLENWNELTEHERTAIMRVLPKRNKERRERLLRKQDELESQTASDKPQTDS